MREIYKSAKPQIFPHYDSAKKLLRKRNSDRYREPQQRFTKPQTGLYTIRARTVITDFETVAMHAISSSTIFPNAQRRGCGFNLGQSCWRRIQTLGMPEDYREELGYFEVVGVFGLSLLPSDEVGTTFANEIMSTIQADDRCRKFADYIADHYTDSGCDCAPDIWASSPQ